MGKRKRERLKDRVKIDVLLLSLLIISTGFLCLNKHLYAVNQFWDNALDFLGMMVMIKGVLWRMAARGHKRAHSQQGSQIVQTGPYALVRNPMYLGSFLIGTGFVVIAWPWWSLPIFALFFYTRFNRQIVAEEKYLTDAFPEEFATYSRKTPRLFPSLPGRDKLKFKEVIDLFEALSTKEVHGLWAWPLMAVILELLQEYLVFGIPDLAGILTVFAEAFGALIIGLWIMSRL